MTPEELALRNNLLTGLTLSYNQLIEKKQKEDGNLIFSRNGKIVIMKARNLEISDSNIKSGVQSVYSIKATKSPMRF